MYLIKVVRYYFLGICILRKETQGIKPVSIQYDAIMKHLTSVLNSANQVK